jgi:hypothetical protein
MKALSVRDILDLGEGDFRGAATFALEVLSRAEADEDHGRDLPVGTRDARLMTVRAASFGHRFELFSRCPACETPVEVGLTAEDIGLAGDGPSTAVRTLRFQDRDLTLRPITAGDLADVERLGSIENVRRALLVRCVTAVDGVDDAPPRSARSRSSRRDSRPWTPPPTSPWSSPVPPAAGPGTRLSTPQVYYGASCAIRPGG